MMISKWMHRLGRYSLLLVVCFAAACNSGDNGFFGGGFLPNGPNPVVDLAVGDDNNQTGNGSQVVLFFDVLNQLDSTGAFSPQASVTLDSATSGVDLPRSLVFAGSDLYVGNIGDATSGNVLIFRNYSTLTDNTAPAVTLGATAGIGKVHELIVDGSDNLIVMDDDNDHIFVFFNASAITTDVAPDVTLDNAGSNISNPEGIAVGGSDLYVANYNSNDLTIYRTISTLADGDAPDATLAFATSFMSLPNGLRGAYVSSNRLFVPSADDLVFVFDNASTLVNDDLPTAVLDNASDVGLTPLDVEVIGTNLFVATRVPNTAANALQGFTPVSSLTNDQVSSFVLHNADGSNIVSSHDFAAAANTLFVATLNDTSTGSLGGAVLMYMNADNLTAGSVDADFQIDSSTSLVRPISVAAIAR